MGFLFSSFLLHDFIDKTMQIIRIITEDTTLLAITVTLSSLISTLVHWLESTASKINAKCYMLGAEGCNINIKQKWWVFR